MTKPRLEHLVKVPFRLAGIRRCTAFIHPTWTSRDLNSEPPPCRGGALPLELQALRGKCGVRTHYAEATLLQSARDTDLLLPLSGWLSTSPCSLSLYARITPTPTLAVHGGLAVSPLVWTVRSVAFLLVVHLAEQLALLHLRYERLPGLSQHRGDGLDLGARVDVVKLKIFGTSTPGAGSPELPTCPLSPVFPVGVHVVGPLSPGITHTPQFTIPESTERKIEDSNFWTFRSPV